MSTPAAPRPSLPSWDESARPVAPTYDDATPAQRQRGDHLRLIHDMYRRGLAQVGDVLDQVRDGRIGVGEARALVAAAQSRVGLDQLGAFCGQLCRSIEAHHGIEDVHLYPALRHASDELHPVLDRLDLEHRVVHELLEGFDAELVAMARGERGSGAAAVAEVDRRFAHLRRLLESHFRYEESSIGTALAVHGIGI